MNVAVVRGTVTVAVASAAARASGGRASQKGLKFVPLTEARQIPVGSFLDTKRGTVELVSATGTGGKTQSGTFTAGLFQVLQSRARAAPGASPSCASRARASSAAAQPARPQRPAAARSRGARSAACARNARGRFRTRGRHSRARPCAAPIWTTTDRCDGTLTQVSRGKVAVRDFRRRRRRSSSSAGKSYLARAPR